MVKDVNPFGSSRPGLATYRGAERRLPPPTFTASGGVLYFTAADGQTGIELWRTDGTEPGTWQVANINDRPRAGGSGRDRSSNPAWLVSLHSDLFFAAEDGTSDIELWRSDGTPAGTRRVKNINSEHSSFPSELTRFKQRVYFSAVTSGRGRELWRTDGARAGTHLFRDINPGRHPSSPYRFAVMRTSE
jgi:ELWxxDGT repeat protein